MVTEEVVAFGLSNVYCSLSPLRANVEIVYSQNQPPQECLLGENLLGGQT